MKKDKPIITRFNKNPILTSKDVPYPVATVHNAGIVKHNDRLHYAFQVSSAATGAPSSAGQTARMVFHLQFTPNPF
jgi:predicted GH43/DUF377 family glycosyl hydrolase